MKPADIELLHSVENMTDDCARDQIGRIENVSTSDRLYGDHAAIAMAAFAHWDWSPGAFSNGSYPVFFFVLDRIAAIQAFGRKLSDFLSATGQDSLQNPIRASLHELTLSNQVIDCRGVPLNGECALPEDAYGAIFHDPHGTGNDVIASLRAGLISDCKRVGEIEFRWDGSNTSWMEVA
jgi:hypothetical protein